MARMTDSRNRRSRLVRPAPTTQHHRQDELVAALRKQDRGYSGTVSRRSEHTWGGLKYVAADETATRARQWRWCAPTRRASAHVRRMARTAQRRESLVVIKTPPGSGPIVAVAIARYRSAGSDTICGDDTLSSLPSATDAAPGAGWQGWLVTGAASGRVGPGSSGLHLARCNHGVVVPNTGGSVNLGCSGCLGRRRMERSTLEVTNYDAERRERERTGEAERPESRKQRRQEGVVGGVRPV